MICFIAQVLNSIAVPVDPIHYTQPERNGNSKQLSSVITNEWREAREKNLAFARGLIRKLTANINSYVIANQRLKTQRNKVQFGKRNPAQTSPKTLVKASLDVGKVPDTVSQPVAVDAGDRLLIPLPNFPPSGIEAAVTGTPLPTTPLITPSLPAELSINLTVDPSPEADPEEVPKLESDGYSNISLDLDGEYVPLTSPPAHASQSFDFIDLSLSPTAEPTMEESEPQPYTYLPLKYDEFEDSGYNPWTAIFVYVRRLLLGN